MKHVYTKNIIMEEYTDKFGKIVPEVTFFPQCSCGAQVALIGKNKYYRETSYVPWNKIETECTKQ